MTSEQIWALVVGIFTSAYGVFLLSHLVWSYRRPLRWGKGRGRVMSRFAVTVTGGSLLFFGIAAFASIFVPAITPIALPAAVIVFVLAGFTAGIVDDLRK